MSLSDRTAKGHGSKSRWSYGQIPGVDRALDFVKKNQYLETAFMDVENVMIVELSTIYRKRCESLLKSFLCLPAIALEHLEQKRYPTNLGYYLQRPGYDFGVENPAGSFRPKSSFVKSKDFSHWTERKAGS